MNRTDRIAAKIVKEDLSLDPLMLKVAEFLKEHPCPSDSDFHSWAEAEKMDKHVAEAAAYRLATLFGAFFFSGRANEKSFGESDCDKEELSKGISVEMEHTSSFAMSKRIALDHLAELPNYYTLLKQMEVDAGVVD